MNATRGDFYWLLASVQQMKTNKQVFARSDRAEIHLRFRLVSIVAGRKTLLLPKSKQERLHGLFRFELCVANMLSQTKKLRSLVDLFTVYYKQIHLTGYVRSSPIAEKCALPF